MRTPATDGLRRAVLVVALANLAYFFVEFAVARRIGSVSLFADSVDFLEDTAVNFSGVRRPGLDGPSAGDAWACCWR